MIDLSTLGTVLTGIRHTRGMTLEAMALAIAVNPAHLSKLERGKAKVGACHIKRYQMIGLSDAEAAAVKSLFVDNPTRWIDCDDCGAHDGEIRPGGQSGDRDEWCANIDTCLNVFVRRWGIEPTSHCPKECTRRVKDTQAFDAAKLMRIGKR